MTDFFKEKYFLEFNYLFDIYYSFIIYLLMKKFLYFTLLFLFTNYTYAYENQGFISYQEIDWNIEFQCDNQCFILVWDSILWDYIDINWSVEGNWSIWYGFLQWQQIIPWVFTQIDQFVDLNQKFNFSDSPYRNQLPKNVNIQIMLLIQWNIKGKIKPSLWEMWVFDTIWNWFSQALLYKSYNPRTINFLEWPIWNGKYINQAFLNMIIILLVIAIIIYLLSTNLDSKRKSIYFWVWVLIFFRIFFDFFSTVNEVKIYNDVIDAPHIMENWRLWKDTDFYQFLDFIKTQVPDREKGFFIAPYPFSFEGKYHIYPNVKFWLVTWVDYLFFYNPYWVNNWVWFIDPIYSSGLLEWDNHQFSISQEITRKPYAKIYRLISK